MSPLGLVAGGVLLVWFQPPVLTIVRFFRYFHSHEDDLKLLTLIYRGAVMLLSKFIEGFVFGVSKTNRLDNMNNSEEEKLLLVAKQVSTGTNKVKERIQQKTPQIPEKKADVVEKPEASLKEEQNKNAEGATHLVVGVKEESKKKINDILNLPNNSFYPQTEEKPGEDVQSVEYVPYDPTIFPNTLINDEIVNNAIDETTRMKEDPIEDKVKISLKKFNLDLNSVTSNNKGSGLFEEVNLAPIVENERGEEFEKDTKNNQKVETERLLIVDIEPVEEGELAVQNLDTFKSKGKLQRKGNTNENNNLKTLGEDFNRNAQTSKSELDLNHVPAEEYNTLAVIGKQFKDNLEKTQSEVEEEMLKDWFQKMEDALKEVQSR